MKRVAVAVLVAVAAFAGAVVPVHAQTINKAAIEQELALLKVQLADLEIQAGMVPFQGAPASSTANLIGGDFAGGITPTQLWTGSAAANSVTPVLSNVTVPGAITQTNSAAVNTLLGTTLANDVIYAVSGWNPTISASTTLSAATFCGATASYVPAGSPAGIVASFSSTTSTYAICPATPGAYSIQTVTNDATNSILMTLGAGMVPRYGYNGSSTLAASSTFIYLGQWTSSSTMEINIFQI